MSKARNIADLLDATGDVVSSALDNVPPSDNASSLTTGTLPVARLADGSITNAKLGNDAKVVKSASAPSSPVEGDLWYDTANETLKIYSNTDSAFVKVVRVTPTLDSISGNIETSTAGNLTLTGTGFLSSNLVISFTPSGGSASTVTVTPTNDTTATVAVPSAIYGQSTGTVITIKVTNSDNKDSGTVNKTVTALPTGGTKVSSGGYTYHTFTSSGTFTNTISNLEIDYLMVAGGGSGGSYGAGGGAGGLLNGSTTLSAQNYSIVIGAGATHSIGSPSHAGGQQAQGSDGNDTTAFSLTAIGGGGGGDAGNNGSAGGSGGGGAYNGTTGGAGTSGQGNAGGGSSFSDPYPSGGGGGAGSVGGNATSNTQPGNGGAGLQFSTYATATSTGDSGYYAGGGGGGVAGGSGYVGGGQTSNGGLGGGGNGGVGGSGQSAGQANTGGGGGSGAYSGSTNSYYPQQGGSGIVILRYADL